MSQELPGSENGIGSIIGYIIRKIPSWIIAIALFGLVVILTIAVLKGQEVDIWVLKIKPHEPPNLPVQDKNAILPSDLFTLSPKYFPQTADKNDADKDNIKVKNISTIRQLIEKNDEIKKMEKKIYYKIAMAELMISEFGTSIDTKSANENRLEAYNKIQAALKEIDFYEGNPDGNPVRTRQSVVDFQTSYNRKYNKDIIPKDELGFFGYYTCFAIGKWSRNQPPDAQASTE